MVIHNIHARSYRVIYIQMMHLTILIYFLLIQFVLFVDKDYTFKLFIFD